MTVFLDANILFSASNTESNLYRFVVWLRDHEKLVTSPYAAEEARRNILVKRPQWQNAHAALIETILLVADQPLDVEAGLPDKDKPVLGAAIAAQCEWLLTGDKRDFGPLYGRTIEGVTIIDVLTFAEVMLKKHAWPD